jgi:hypothetical protein
MPSGRSDGLFPMGVAVASGAKRNWLYGVELRGKVACVGKRIFANRDGCASDQWDGIYETLVACVQAGCIRVNGACARLSL